MKVLPEKVRTLISASNQVNSHNKAVEELVYNSLDARATSIAIRINVQDNSIQVIDNGCGVSKEDFNFIGQNYMTSKFIDLSTLRSAPNTYGYRGQSLANIIRVSNYVKITSRHENSNETLEKLFDKGKEKEICKSNTRPSKGTTVEVKGFLYNLSIQKKSRDILNELQSIKTFLEHLSLVHSNISLSLRDDSKNEIIFKIHKNRDMYQTISTLYDIEKKDLQELRVEKNEYKVLAFLEKNSKESERHLIFLNGKIIPYISKLHQVVNNNLNKHFKLGDIRSRKIKNVNIDEESGLFRHKIPFYCILISCPYMDYNLSNSPKQSVLEFKNWDQVNKLLEKLVKFFTGDMNLKEVSKTENNKATLRYGIKDCSSTREQVKKIMEKILGSHPKKSGVADTHKGIKGKQIKRKANVNRPVQKIIPKVNNENSDGTRKFFLNNEAPNKDFSQTFEDKKNSFNNRNDKKKNIQRKKHNAKKYSKSHSSKSCLGTNIGKMYNLKLKQVSNHNYKEADNEIQAHKAKIRSKTNKIKQSCNKNEILKKFEMETDSVKKRCAELEQLTKNILNKRKYEVQLKEIVELGKLTKNNRNVTGRKKNYEIVIHDYIPKAPKVCLTKDNHDYNVKKKSFQSNYDLVQTILKSDDSNVQRQIRDNNPTHYSEIMSKPSPNNATCETYRPLDAKLDKDSEPVITFQSHNYNAQWNFNRENNKYQRSYHKNTQIENNDYPNFHKKPRTFITKNSTENFLIPNNKHSHKHNVFKQKFQPGYSKHFKNNIKKLYSETSKLFQLKKQIMGKTGDSSYTIQFTESNIYNKSISKLSDCSIPPNLSRTIHKNNNDSAINTHFSLKRNTYTVPNTDENVYIISDNNWNNHNTYIIQNDNESRVLYEDFDIDNELRNNSDNINKNTSKFHEHDKNEQVLDPLDVCETILHSHELFNEELELSINNRQNQCCDHTNNLQTKHTDNNRFDTHGEDPSRKSLCEPNYTLNHDESINDISEEFSHHFTVPNSNANINNITEVKNAEVTKLQYKPDNNQFIHDENIQEILEEFSHNFNFSYNNDENNDNNTHDIATEAENQHTNFKRPLYVENSNDKNSKKSDLGNFDLKDRLCFLPKGMSPIFENCYTKITCEYNLTEDYYDEKMYNNFVDNVRNHVEVFEPKIQEAKELTTKAIDKVNAKINKDNSSLKFDGLSLKQAKVLGQVDEKFIAAIMKGGVNKEEESDFLVLFDQHAVHERIRLETNLSDYLIENQWKMVNIDEITLRMAKDNVLYLHNYKDKFAQLGLQWTVQSNDKISIHAIPEAILGKNPREVDKVLKAVKNLITEEISMIKMQGGCVSLYPKSIMDLVFSEACRYAIKFGDKLSKSRCVELLKMLSECKTPFQCAHGRPVMAVIMNNKPCSVYYEVNIRKIFQWKERCRRT